MVYIDESGDEGLDFGRGASGWFVLSAIVTRALTDLDTVKLVDRVREILKKPEKKPLHFRDLRHEHRLPFVEQIAQARVQAVSVMIHKPSIVAAETFREPHRLYFYAVRYLLERVSWLCRDARRPEEGDGSARIFFSNRSGMSYEDLRAYLELLKTRETTVEWSVIRCDQIQACSAGKKMGLQIADAVAHAFFRAVEPTAYGHTEDRYARMLRPVVYRYKKNSLGYGIKLWPREIEAQVPTHSTLSWLREAYLPGNTKKAGPGPQDPTR